MKAETSLINEWLSKNGGPRQFERGLMTGFHGSAYFLRRFGFELWRYGNRYRISLDNGRWQPISRSEIVRLIDTLRVLESREPIQVPCQ